MKILLITLIIILNVSCEQKFRNSLCPSYLKNIPEKFIGTYKINIQDIGDSDFKRTGGDETFIHITKLTVLSSHIPQNVSVTEMKMNFCEINGYLIQESVDAAGFYSYSMIKNHPDGLYFTPLVLKGNTDLHFRHVPDVKFWEDGEWSSGSVIVLGNKQIVDNQKINSKEVFSNLISSSMIVFYQRVKPSLLNEKISWKSIYRFK
ncbi:hypothetical protein N9N67_00115 [Bacteriovoracaceae bacterium]|nr:hypothetical protein [Bacteriovoracaceae bacterium]